MAVAESRLASMPANSVDPRLRPDYAWWMAVLLCSTLLGCGITSASLWIDEGFSAWVAAHPTLSDMVSTLAAGDVSDRQMPLHYFWLYLWSHYAGSSEALLRAANLPFAAVYVASLALVSKFVFGRRFAWMPLAISPFAFYYVNEARAYFMLLSLTTASYSAFLVYLFGPPQYRRRAAWVFCPAFLLACMAHMLAGFVVPAMLVMVWFARREGLKFKAADWRAPAAVFAPMLLALGAFYAVNLARNTAYDYGKPSIAHFALALYEHAGFAGLGPPRNALRSPALNLFEGYWVWLLLGLAGLVYCLITALRRRLHPHACALAIAWAVAFACAIAAAYLMNSRFLARHITALLPPLLFAIMALLTLRRQWIVLALVWGLSDVRGRFIPEYWKDDYRSAVRDVIARQQARPGVIAWAADPLTANYYGLALEDRDRARYYEFDYAARVQKAAWPARARGVIAENWNAAAVRTLLTAARPAREPVYFVLSKPDLYDTHAGWGPWLAARRLTPSARYRSFEVYVLD